jgi:hypothetical protein
MDANSSTIGRFKAQCNKFSGIISKGLPKAMSRLVKEMVYGIQASKDVKLSNITRVLQESIPLIKTEDRLSRNLSSVDITEHINNQILRLADDKITNEMVIAIDPGDITKPYAKAMEHLCGIWNGSEGVPSTGYHLCQVTAANLEHNKIVPLYCEAYSSAEEGYVTATKKINAIISKVAQAVGNQGVWAIDRQGDCKEIIDHFVDNQLKFVTRLRQGRWLNTFNKNGGIVPVIANNLEKHMPINYEATLTKIDDGITSTVKVKFGVGLVGIKGDWDNWYRAVVIKGVGKKPMILLTNIEVDYDDPCAAYRILEIYLTRWKCEECYRYIKQSYNLEDIRVRSYCSIRNTVSIVHAIAYFTSIYIGVNLKLKVMIQRIFILSKKFFGIPAFYNYALADGIFELLKKATTGVLKNIKHIKQSAEFQLSLFPD